jgi:hypothetical protein
MMSWQAELAAAARFPRKAYDGNRPFLILACIARHTPKAVEFRQDSTWVLIE